ncbi:dimethlysulfonioproprionate lyase DddL [Rhodospirillaceae bacterium KN72]|uniref:Dimethlysulfonioproprionate lyase DddL n=1 Tax=Pacificispira spongiicola TaxID=2729598 RepID=A0A7Y0E325_9PROT|nr:dimethylsulfonioproprionate lyase family protein [Pacificispira spongiicola]NMM46324.1 dimethlysulfonioproprionate lyase DddL [Pacificispira spongiicola]
MRLSTQPDWQYLVRDFYELYQTGSAGGSSKIRSHLAEVRRLLGKVFEDDPTIVEEEAVALPVCDHLSRALSNATGHRTAKLARSLDAVRDHLRWQYGYEKVPKGLTQKYGFTEIMGPRGPIFSDRIILGFVLFGPKTTYPAHSHKGITESYYCVSGNVSENDVGVYAPGSLIFNQAGHSHRITTPDREPSLLAWAWVGTAETLVNNKMTFAKT